MILSPAMKLLVISAAAVLLAAGWSLDNTTLSIAGVVAYGLVSLGGLVWQVRASRYYRQGQDDKWNAPKTTVEKAAGIIESTVTMAGLAAPFVAVHDKAAESGFAIWIIAVVSWIANGIIVQNVAGIPLRMTYGGWKVQHRRRRRRWS